MGFLSALSFKDYFLGALVALLIGALMYEHHEGELVVERKDAALKAAATALNKASENLADIKELNIGQVYEKYIALPPVHDAGLVCHSPAAVKPQTASGGPGAPDTSAPVRDGSFDPSGPILTLLRDSDAQVAGLIATVLNLEAELAGITK